MEIVFSKNLEVSAQLLGWEEQQVASLTSAVRCVASQSSIMGPMCTSR